MSGINYKEIWWDFDRATVAGEWKSSTNVERTACFREKQCNLQL